LPFFVFRSIAFEISCLELTGFKNLLGLSKQDMLKKQDSARSIAMRMMEEKTFDALKDLVTLDMKKVSIEEFNKFFEAK